MSTTAAKTPWFDVDREGLAKLLEGRPKSFILHELVQNAWDEAAINVTIWVERIYGTKSVEIVVIDDNPEGFSDLTHAYTLFAESGKKSSAEKRGRFNMGEKLVLAMAQSATIQTTKGTVYFGKDGRETSRSKRPAGSEVRVTVKMNDQEMHDLIQAAHDLLPPVGIVTTINGLEIKPRNCLYTFDATLPTVIGDEQGVLRKSERKTHVKVFQPRPGEKAMIFEMGIPVVETGDRFHVDVQQKVPLNMDRDNVTPTFLRAVRVEVLNHTYREITEDDAASTWVKEACSDSRVEHEAIREAINLRFGEDAVAYDPSDPEANKLSVAQGRKVVHGGTLSGAEWRNAREAGLLPPAGKVTPSPKPYSPDGKPLTFIPEESWSPGMRQAYYFSRAIANKLFGRAISVKFVNEATWPFNATYGPGDLVFNVGRLGHRFFMDGITEELIDLLIHEFGHEKSSDHLSSQYFDALTKIGAQMTMLALKQPFLFNPES